MDVSSNGRQRIYRLLWHMAARDGDVSAEERTVLEEYRGTLDIDEESAARLEAEGIEGDSLRLGKRKHERRMAFEAVAHVMVADGVLHPDEAAWVNKLASAMQISPKAAAQALQRALRSRWDEGD